MSQIKSFSRAVGEGEKAIGEAGGELASEERMMQKASEVSIEGVPQTFIEGAPEIQKAVLGGQELVAAEIKTGGTLASLTEKLKEVGRYMWQNKAAFAKMMGTEIAKGAFFTVGMIAVEKIFAAKVEKEKTPENQQRFEIVRAINKERRVINPIMKDWRSWLADHYDNRKDYGVFTVEGEEIEKFQVLQNSISEAQHYSDETVAAASTALKEDQDMESAKALLKAERAWVDKVKAVSDKMQSKYPLLVTAGLKENKTEIAQGKKYLDDVNI